MVSPTASVVDQISAAMSVSNLQHQVNVSNIANRESQGYQRMKLKFEHAMGEPQAATVVTDTSNVSVSLEQDMVAMSTNLMHYETLARSLGRYFAIIASIANPSRG